MTSSADRLHIPFPVPRALRTGSLPPDGPLRLAEVDLGPGRLWRPTPAPRRWFGRRQAPPPVGWVTTASLPDPVSLWADLAAAYPQTGLWPVVVDVPDVLAQRWTSGYLDPDEDPDDGPRLAPFDRTFPGLAPAPAAGSGTGRSIDPAPVQQNLPGSFDLDGVWRTASTLALVPCRRPADAVEASGWPGAPNADLSAVVVSAVLRSWEDRFGATLLALGADSLALLVTRPPRTREQALAVAAEHHALCPDTVMQGTHTLEAAAEDLLEHPDLWSFWWD